MTEPNDEKRVLDVPPRPDLPRERPTTSRWTGVLTTLVLFIISFATVNHLASLYLGRYTSNRGYWIVHQKWELLENQDEPVDWLILGDSSCNQGVVPAEWDHLTEGKSLNLCTIGNMVTVDDAWMLERYIERHGAPKNVLVMHVYDMWHRDLNNALLGQIPLGYGFWDRWDPKVELTFDDWKSLVVSRYFPLYSQNASLKDAARKGLEQMSWEAPFKRDFVMDEQGYMPWDRAFPRGVRGDAGGHIRFLTKTPFSMSSDARAGLEELGKLADEHKIQMHFVPSPVVNTLGRNAKFRGYRKALDDELATFAERHPTVTHHPKVHEFRPEEMENADHVITEAAIRLTRMLAEDIANIDLDKRASSDVLKPSSKPDAKIGTADAWTYVADRRASTPEVTPELVTGLSLEVPIRLDKRPAKQAAVVSQWSTGDNARSFELGINELQQPYLAISPDGQWNRATLMLTAEQQLRLGEDALVSVDVKPGKSAEIWINGQRVAHTARGVPNTIYRSKHPVRLGDRAAKPSSYAFQGALGTVVVEGRPAARAAAARRTRELGLPPQAPAFLTPQQLTKPPGKHWFGYYDKHQFSPDQTKLLVMKTPFEGRKPKADDVIEIGLIDLENGNAYEKIGESRAWSWQQGCMLQWRPGSTSEVLWNDRDGDRFVTRILDLETRKTRTIPHAIYHVAPDGKYAVDADFARIQHMRPGYGYPGVPDPNGAKLQPDNRPIQLIDLDTGTAQPIVDYADFVDVQGPRANPKEGAKHYVNHLQFSPDGQRIMFLHRWRPKGRGGFATRVFTVRTDGTQLQLLTDDGGLSHYTWRDERSLLIWASQHGGYAVYDVENGFQSVLLALENGHQSYVPGTDNRWLVTDTYPGDDGKQTLLLYDTQRDELLIVARLPTNRRHRGEFRTDLHPRLSRDGTRIVVDSGHRGGRQQYIFDISSWISGE